MQTGKADSFLTIVVPDEDLQSRPPSSEGIVREFSLDHPFISRSNTQDGHIAKRSEDTKRSLDAPRRQQVSPTLDTFFLQPALLALNEDPPSIA